MSDAPARLARFAPPSRTAIPRAPSQAALDALRRYLTQTGALLPDSSYQAKLLGWLEVAG